MRATHPHPTRRQRGTTLIEALVAFLVLSVGMLTVARMQTQLRAGSDLARQRSEAVRLAQEDIESLRAFAVLAASAGARSYEGLANGSRTVDAASGYATPTTYLVTRQIDGQGALHAKTASVTVGWADRAGNAQQLALNSVIAGTDPAYSGALTLARSGLAMKAFGRSSLIPHAAKDLGNGSSAFKPVSNGSIALVFDNTTGLLTARCDGVSAAVATSALTIADLSNCDNRVGHLLSGTVRFSSASPPDAAQARDVPLTVAVSLLLSGGSYATAPICSAEAVTTGDRHVAYHCAVYPLASGRWSGRATLVPAGWAIGTSASDKRVCRYTADLDGSGAIDTNIEHPASYSGVVGSLAHQNFLVINGGDACPAGHTAQVSGNSSDVFANLGTVQHQP